jgi:catechol 2,3-dioxygenase-like lactoylglutathione lyase family enzyme
LRFWQDSSSRREALRLARDSERPHLDVLPKDGGRPAKSETGMIQVKRMSHATFVTPDLERQIDYFTGIAGLALAERENGRAYLATKVGDLAVQIEKGDHAQCARIAFQVAPDTPFDDIRRGLEAEGVRPQVKNDAVPGVPRMLTFEDPKGTMIEVFAEQAPIAKNQEVKGIGPLKLGHLAFCVAEPKAFAEYYGRVLGFRVSDWIQDWFVFMRCGPDHHTVNFVRGKRTQMHHVAFELKDWPQILQACDVLGRNNIQLAWGPGRHGPGHNIYTYHRNPDDQIIELFTELDKMSDEELGYFDPKPWHRDRPQVPKVWNGPRDIWGMPPTPDYARQRE